MTDRPIIFSSPMIRALLEGRKTMTRRIMSLQNCEFGSISAGNLSKLYWQHTAWDRTWIDRGYSDWGYLHVPCHDNNNHCATCSERGWSTTSHRLRPKVQIGDRLWVREAAAYIDNSEFGQPSYWQYRADTNGRDLPGDWPDDEKDNPDRPRWRPSIHMPREASRLTLIVTAVKIERLQDISVVDVRAEGCEVRHFWLFGADGPQRQRIAAGVFGDLWSDIHGRESWDQNPFVVAITFRPIKANVDAPEARAVA